MDQASESAVRGGVALAEPRASAVARSASRARFNRWMRVARRVHLYAGLFMVPWVFLYGITAMLFNHPDAFADAPGVPFTGAETRATALGSLPGAGALAERVVAALNARAGAGSTYRLVEPSAATFSRDLIGGAKGDGVEYNVRLNLADGSGTVRSATKKVTRPAPFATSGKNGVKLDAPPFDAAARGLTELLGRLGLAATDASVRTLPDLSFRIADAKGEVWRATYNVGNGQVSGRPDAAPGAGPTLRRELLQLHLAHGFPREVNARWVWAIFVDLMFLSMVGWGFTGLLMWWQMKNVRRIGLVVLLASLVAATVMAAAMHATFVAEAV